MIIKAEEVTDRHVVEVLDILDYYDSVGVVYPESMRNMADEELAVVVGDSYSEVHRETGEPITVLLTDQGAWAVPSSLRITVVRMEY